MSLESVRLKNVRNSISLQDCGKLSLDSMAFLVGGSNPQNNVTVTVHPDVYAKLTDPDNAEWSKVMADGAAKNITFASA